MSDLAAWRPVDPERFFPPLEEPAAEPAPRRAADEWPRAAWSRALASNA